MSTPFSNPQLTRHICSYCLVLLTAHKSLINKINILHNHFAGKKYCSDKTSQLWVVQSEKSMVLINYQDYQLSSLKFL